MQFLVAAIVIVGVVILIRVWTGAMNVSAVEGESLASVEKRHPYLPKMGMIVVSAVIGGGLFLLSLKYGKATSLSSLIGSTAILRTLFVFAVVLILGNLDIVRWKGLKDRRQYLYAFVLGTLATWILIQFKRSIFEYTTGPADPFMMALGVTCLVIGWRFLFGQWSASMKVTVLGTAMFWITYAFLKSETKNDLVATAIAAAIAIIPPVIWCRLFLSYHKTRLDIVLLAFFAGMLSTVPILFYSSLMQHGINELNFFIFKIIPINYGTSSQQFVQQSIFKDATGASAIVLTTLVTYLVVGVIEEVSKYWVFRHSSKEFFRSIDDTLQLAIVVALGFAFAENIANPSYFVGFVQQFQLNHDWASLIASVVGRGVLTTMVHVLSTGVMGYFFGVALYASPIMAQKNPNIIVRTLHSMLETPHWIIYARLNLVIGLLSAILIHGLFDFTVSLSDVLPGHPATIGALFGMPATSILSAINITLVPSLLYVVGGFWLLVTLFQRKDSMKEYGTPNDHPNFIS